MRKKWLLSFAALCLSLATVGFIGCGEDGEEVDDNADTNTEQDAGDETEEICKLQFEEGEDDTCIVKGIGTHKGEEVIIPETYKDMEVVGIADGAFKGRKELTNVVIPATVTTIGAEAFSGCSGLTSIEIPDSVESIGDNAFNGCKELETIEEDGLKYIGSTDNTYLYLNEAGKKDVESVTIDTNCKFIGASAFSVCDKLKSVKIPDGVIGVSKAAFVDCVGLERIEVDENNTMYASHDGILYNAEITEIVFVPENIQGSLKLPDSVTSIAASTFKKRNGLTSVEIPDGVEAIGEDAFRDCPDLTSVKIPDSVEMIGNNAFKDCEKLTYKVEGKLKYLGNNKNPYIYLAGVESNEIESATINTDCKFIGTAAFDSCEKLASIVIPDGLISVGADAFSGCKSITNATLSTVAIADIPKSKLEKVVITSGEKIAENAFASCSTLTSVEIGDKVVAIGKSAFTSCGNLTSVVIKNGVETIGGEAFASCGKLTSISIPKSVTKIGYKAFVDCAGLTSIKVDGDNSAYESKDGVLYDVQDEEEIKLVYVPENIQGSVTILDDVKVITASSFYDRDGLTSITITSSVETIESGAFGYCDGLTSVVIPDSVTTLGYSAFWHCGNLSKIVVGKGVTAIGASTFYNCDKLTSVTINGKVTAIGNEAFYECDGLTSITLPDSVTTIGTGAFSYCDKLKNITFSGTTEEWDAITKGTDWHKDTPVTKANCKDGDGTLDKDDEN